MRQIWYMPNNPTISTRKAYGQALVNLGSNNSKIVVLDAETSNSTYAEIFKNQFPDRFIECFIAEQNMVSMATGLSRMGYTPFVSTFAAFFTRCADQIRMARYSESNINFVGSHCGVSIGYDGTSQMGLEDISLFRCILDSVVLYPSDQVSTIQLVNLMASRNGINYLRTTREDLPVLYSEQEQFEIGGSKTLRSSDQDQVTIIAAGITLHQALKAYDDLQVQGINVRIIDLYSIKPLDTKTLQKACTETKALIVVEDHYPQGGIYEAVCSSGSISKPIYSLAVNKMPRSGSPAELLRWEQIDSQAIVAKVKEILA
jgi:transketolase